MHRSRHAVPARRATPAVLTSASGSAITSPSALKPEQLSRQTLDYEAFCAMYRWHYLRYARTRIGDQRIGAGIVWGTLTDLAAGWPEVLREPSPTAHVWHLLSTRITACVARTSAGASALYALLPARQADAVLLRYRLGLSVRCTSEVMGIEVSVALGELRMASRTLSTGVREPLRGRRHR